MGFDEEWAQAKAEAREEIARTRLNGSPESAGGSGRLVLHGEDVGPIGEQADGLAASLREHGLVADNPTRVAGILLRTPGFETGRALVDVADTWQSQVETLKESCLGISQHLRYTLTSHAGGELENQAEMIRAQTSPAAHHISNMA
ncbi:hypothetical protein [Streptomyces sp. NRRL F-2890]|uniref:hypothetical protein n=1 Tax=Streptomyces sp. NRRL F-2890 TaxID=1463845 RepID=UPI000694104D|nr:hypothetical protein [Streptomyces sp. NRRL F-2890]